MTKSKIAMLMVSAFVLGGCVSAGSQQLDNSQVLLGSSTTTAQIVEENIKSKYPKTTIRSVSETALNGIYEVVMGDNFAYTDVNGRYFLFGHLFDMQTQQDLTAMRKVEAKKTEFPDKFLANAIKTVNGNGSRVMAYFTDPNCPYCREIERELQKVENVTIYTFLYPILGQESKIKATAVWCSNDKAQAWQEYMLSRKLPQLKSCDNPMDANITLGAKLGVNGTPALISKDGRVLTGANTAMRIEQWLNVQTPEVSKK